MIGVLVKQGVVLSFDKDTAGFPGSVTVLIFGDWSKVVSDGIRRLECIRLRSSWSTSRRLLVLLGFL